MDELKLSDRSIGHIAKLLQVALLTGTDVVDNLRLIGFQNNDGKLDLHPNHEDAFNKSVVTMVDEASQKQVLEMIDSGNLPEGITKEELTAQLKAHTESVSKLKLPGDTDSDVEEW
ncbi:hypothetical protein OAA09_00750 [bacterium]|nr:hypothetical protein [bacterium]